MMLSLMRVKAKSAIGTELQQLRARCSHLRMAGNWKPKLA